MTAASADRAELERLQERNRQLEAELLRLAHGPCEDWSWQIFGCQHDRPKHQHLCGKCRTCWPCAVTAALDLATPEASGEVDRAAR